MLSSFHALFKEISAIKNCKIVGWQSANEPYIFAVFLKQHCTKSIKYVRHKFPEKVNCVLPREKYSIFGIQCMYSELICFVAQLENEAHILMRQKL